MTTLAAELVDTESGLEALRPEWEALRRRVPGATPFQSPFWLLPWWRCFGTGLPRIATLRDADRRLLGLLPLYLLLDGAARKLLPIGAGITDYHDALLAADAPRDAAGALLRTVLAGSADAMICDLIELPPGAALRDAATPPGWRAAWAEGPPCPVLALPGAGTGLRGAVPARTLRKLRMNRHRAGRIGGWTVETAGSGTLPGLLDELVRLHTRRWEGRGEAGVLADPDVLAFHRAAAPGLLEAGLLRLRALRLQGRVAAVIYALLAGPDRILFYLSGFDAAWAHQSPGTILLGEMLEEAVREGRREAHFLRGGEAYKYAWGAADRMNAACRLTRA